MKIGAWLCYDNQVRFFPKQSSTDEIAYTISQKNKDKLFSYDIKEIEITTNTKEVTTKDINITFSTESSDMYRNNLIQLLYYIWNLFMKFRMNQDRTHWQEGGIVIEGYHQIYLMKNTNSAFQKDVWEYKDLTTNKVGYYKALESRIYIHPYIAWVYLFLRLFLAVLTQEIYFKTPYVMPTFLSISLLNRDLWDDLATKQDVVLHLLRYMRKDPKFNTVIEDMKSISSSDSSPPKDKIMKMLKEPITSLTITLQKSAKENPKSFIGIASNMGLLEKSVLMDIVEINLDYFWNKKFNLPTKK